MSRPSSTSTHQQVAPTVPPLIHALASPVPTMMDAQLPSYLMPQVLSLLRGSAEHVLKKKIAQEESLREEGLLPPSSSSGSSSPGKGKGKATKEEEELMLEMEVNKRVERIGLMVGGYIAEKLTLARAPLASHLDIIKFICKDLFLFVYSKQIDNLRTNHRGTFVLQSTAFPPLMSLSSYRGAAADQEAAKSHLVFPQAIVQGALTRLGMPAIVTAETSGLPQCTFQIRTVKAPGPTPSATPGMGTTPKVVSQSASMPTSAMPPSSAFASPRPASTALA